MIETMYRGAANTPAPRTPELITPEERGDEPCDWIDDSWRAAQTLGLEILWSSDYTLSVRRDGASLAGEIDMADRKLQAVPPLVSNIVTKLDDKHYRVRLDQQIVIPRGFVGLILPHPRFFDAIPHFVYNDTPSVIPRVHELDKSPDMLELICRLPSPGAEHVFYAGKPICQLVIVPRGFINVRNMTEEEVGTWVGQLRAVQTTEAVDAP